MKNRVLIVINFNKDTILVSFDDDLIVIEMTDWTHVDDWYKFSNFGKEYDLNIRWSDQSEPIVTLHNVVHNQRESVGVLIEKVVVLDNKQIIK